MQNKIIRLLLFTVLAFVFATESSAQGGFTRPNTIYGTRMYRLGIDSAFFLPTFCGAPSSLRSFDLKQAMLYYDSCNAAMYVRNPKTNTWAQLSAAADELYILNQFATKESKAFNIRSGRLDSLYAAGSGGLHFVNNGGTTAFEYGAGGGTQVTFNGFAGYNANRAASYTARSFTDKNYVDSAIAAGGSGGPTYTAGNGIKIEGDSTIRLADTLIAANTEIRVPYDEGAETFAVNGYRNGSAETVGILVSPLQQRVSLIGADAIGGTSATIQVNSSGTISMIGRPMNLIIDSIRLVQSGPGTAYQARPAAGTIGRYRVALMDATTGALVTVARDSAGYIINPMTTTGDLIVGGASGAAGRLGIGTNGQVLTSNGTTATWATPASGGSAAGATGNIQFRRADGGFSAVSTFTYDSTNARVGVGLSSPLRLLHVQSTSQGILIPRMTTTQRNAIGSPLDGELLYDTDLRSVVSYDQSATTWVQNRSLLENNASTNTLFVKASAAVTGANSNNTILQFRTNDFPGSGHVIAGRLAAASATGTPIGMTIVGHQAGFSTSGNYSTLVGELSGYNVGNTVGNTLFGAYTFAQGGTPGAGNSIVGAFNHRYGLASAAYNSSIGYQSNQFGGGSYNITIGAFVDQQTASATGHLNIGNVIYGLGLHQSASNSSTPTSNGQVGIGVAQSGISASARLQVDATDRGFLGPRMTTTQMNAIASPAAGLQIYNTTENAMMYYDGTRWVGFRFNGTVYQGYNSGSGTWTDLN